MTTASSRCFVERAALSSASLASKANCATLAACSGDFVGLFDDLPRRDGRGHLISLPVYIVPSTPISKNRRIALCASYQHSFVPFVFFLLFFHMMEQDASARVFLHQKNTMTKKHYQKISPTKRISKNRNFEYSLQQIAHQASEAVQI